MNSSYNKYGQAFKNYIEYLEKEMTSMYSEFRAQTAIKGAMKDMDKVVEYNKYLVDKLGKFNYKIIEHPIIHNDILDRSLGVKQLDVITLKNILNILNNTRMIVVGPYDFFEGWNLYIHDGTCNLKDLQEITNYFNIFSKDVVWIQIDGITDSYEYISELDIDNVNKYFANDSIRFFMYNNMPIPRVKFIYDDGFIDRISETKMDNPFVKRWISINVKKKAAGKEITVDDIINDKCEDLCIKALEHVMDMTSDKWSDLISHYIDFYVGGRTWEQIK